MIRLGWELYPHHCFSPSRSLLCPPHSPPLSSFPPAFHANGGAIAWWTRMRFNPWLERLCARAKMYVIHPQQLYCLPCRDHDPSLSYNLSPTAKQPECDWLFRGGVWFFCSVVCCYDYDDPADDFLPSASLPSLPPPPPPPRSLPLAFHVNGGPIAWWTPDAFCSRRIVDC